MKTMEVPLNAWHTRHDRFGIANAVPHILNDEVIEFNSYSREMGDSTTLNHVEKCYIGLEDSPEEDKKEGYGKALRISSTSNLDEAGSHSLIPSWEPNNAINPIHIALAIKNYFGKLDIFVKLP